MKSWTIGKKLVFGFAVVMAITIGLGALAYWNGAKIAGSSDILANEVAPVAAASAQVTKGALQAVFETRGYLLNNDEKHADQALASLADVEKSVNELEKLAASRKLDQLEKEVADLKSSLTTYSRLLNEDFQLQRKFQAEGAKIRQVGPKMTQAIGNFAVDQQTSLAKEIQTVGADKTALADRLKKNEAATSLALSAGVIRANASNFITLKTPAYSKAALEELAKVQSLIQGMDSTAKTDKNQSLLGDVKTCVDEYQTGLAALSAISEQVQANDKERTPAYDQLLKIASGQLDAASAKVKASSTETMNAVSANNQVMVGGIIVAILVGSFLALIIVRSLTGAITRIAASLLAGSQQTAAAAAQVSSASQSLAQGASEQAAAIEETTSSVEEMASMTKQNASNANEAKNLAASTKADAEKGTQAMVRMSQAIDDIKQSSDKTAKIVKTIDEIAFQTNLLALNAAVEAARAGEAGKGFAVVAEEVRNLAQRSAEAAKNTASMIEESVKNSNNGVQISKEVGDSLTEIGEAARKVNDLIGEIAAASNEQSQGIDQISTAVGQMDQVTQQNAANAEESAAASEELSAQAEELNKMVAELSAMAGGSGKAVSGGSSRVTKDREAHFAHDAGKSAGAAKKPSARKPNIEDKMPGGVASPARSWASGKVNPQDVIPMENEQELAKF
jgi:methyl-accepting chemotaxis protein